MFGSHLSIAGGMHHAIDAAAQLRLQCVQVFTANQRQWKITTPDAEACARWHESLASTWGAGSEPRAVAHDSYLINLASPDDELWKKSTDAMIAEIRRCASLGIVRLVSHPGAHMGTGVDAGLARIAHAFATIIDETADADVMVCHENTAGAGTTLGRTFDELAQLRAMIITRIGRAAESRFGFCLDTCHALAAGYDIASCADDSAADSRRTHEEGFALGQEMLREFDASCGLQHLEVIHLNDSMTPRGSRRDRHQHIGMGHVAPGAFAAVINCPALANRWDGLGVPMVLETPKGVDDRGRAWDSRNLATLRRLVRINVAPRASLDLRKVALASGS